MARQEISETRYNEQIEGQRDVVIYQLNMQYSSSDMISTFPPDSIVMFKHPAGKKAIHSGLSGYSGGYWRKWVK